MLPLLRHIPLFLFSLLIFPLVFPQSWNLKSLGATGEKSQLATNFFQLAIDSAYKNGGGVVYVPPGEYTIGTIVLKDNITLHIEAGATIYASRNINDYRMPLEHAVESVLIYANGAQNITIKGKGIIHGQAEREYLDLMDVDPFITDITANARKSGVEMKMYYKIPPITFMLFMTNCTNLTFEDFSMIESQFWTLHLLNCDRINMRGLYVYSDLEKGVNADGIDLNACRDVRISDCNVITGDDAIVLKSWGVHDRPCENIVVTNCVLTSSSTALKIGTESYGDFRHIIFSNCVIRNSNRGLSIVVRDGAHVSDVLFSNITIECNRRHFNWWGNGDPIWVVLKKRRESSAAGSIENIVFRDITAEGRGTSKIESFDGVGIRNIELNNVQIRMKYEDYKDKRATHAFAAYGVEDLRLKNFNIDWAADTTEKNWQCAMDFDEINGLEIDGFRGRQGLVDSDYPVVRMQNVQDAMLDDMETEAGAKTFFTFGGKQSRNIRIGNVDRMNNALRRISREPGLAPDAIIINDD